jgi:hypothetical protein
MRTHAFSWGSGDDHKLPDEVVDELETPDKFCCVLVRKFVDD